MDSLNSKNLVIYDATNVDLPNESLVIAFNYLPSSIKNIREEWGFSDTVFGDEVYRFF